MSEINLKPPLPPPTPERKPIKPIYLKLTQRAALDWTNVGNYVSNKKGVRASNVDIAVELIQAYKDRKQLIEDLRVSESKLRKKDDEIFQLLKESINRPININVGALAQATSLPIAPPKPAILSTNAKPMIREMNSKFLEGKLKPSEIMTAEFDDIEFLEIEDV